MVSAGFFQSILGVILGVGMCSHVIGSVITSLASVRPAIKTPQYPPVSAGGYGIRWRIRSVSASGYRRIRYRMLQIIRAGHVKKKSGPCERSYKGNRCKKPAKKNGVGIRHGGFDTRTRHIFFVLGAAYKSNSHRAEEEEVGNNIFGKKKEGNRFDPAPFTDRRSFLSLFGLSTDQ